MQAQACWKTWQLQAQQLADRLVHWAHLGADVLPHDLCTGPIRVLMCCPMPLQEKQAAVAREEAALASQRQELDVVARELGRRRSELITQVGAGQWW